MFSRFPLKLLAVLILLSFCFSAHAQDWTTYTTEELQQMLTGIATEIGARNESAAYEGLDSAATIAELFPDEVLAMAVRDALDKLSIKQPVTQEELDSITSLTPTANGKLSSLEGISHLRNLETLYFSSYSPGDGWAYSHELVELPDEICELKKLRELNLRGYAPKMVRIPERIGELTQLRVLDLSKTKINRLPESMGNLVNLETLNLSKTDLDYLPEFIGNLVNLATLNISYTDISELPDSIWGLSNLDVNLTGSKVK